MEAVFQTVLELSGKAGLVIPAVLLVRLALKKAPRKYSYLLWAVVGFRLICPVSVSSVVSIFNVVDRVVPAPMGSTAAVPDLTMPVTVPAVPQAVTPAPAAIPAAAPAAIDWFGVAAAVWCVGIAVLLGYAVVSVWHLRRRLSTAVRLEENVYQSEAVASPFILGLFRPRIYVPYGLEGQALAYVLAHERTHLRCGDHLVKLLAFGLLAVHWFNPLVWLAFFLMSRDMEMRCDEAVLARNGYSAKAYSETLLSFAVKGRFPAPVPLAFGETAVKSRIQNALDWKRPKLWVTVLAALLCVLALVACGTGAKEREEPDHPAFTPRDEFITNVIESTHYRPGEFFQLTIPEGYDYPEHWQPVMLKTPDNGYLYPGNLEKRTEWEPGKTYEVDISDVDAMDLIIRLPTAEGNIDKTVVHYDFFQWPWYDLEPKTDWHSQTVDVLGVVLGNRREQITAALGREPDGETVDGSGSTVLFYHIPEQMDVYFTLQVGSLVDIRCCNVQQFRGDRTLEEVLDRYGGPDSVGSNDPSGQRRFVNYQWSDPGSSSLVYYLWFEVQKGEPCTLSGTMGLYLGSRNDAAGQQRLDKLVYTENVYTKDWWVSIDPADYGITGEELAADPLPDFTAMDLPALGAYVLNTDGAGAEGSISEFYARFVADPVSVLEYLSSLGWGVDRTGVHAVQTLCYHLITMNLAQFDGEGTFSEIFADTIGDGADSRVQDLANYLVTQRTRFINSQTYN